MSKYAKMDGLADLVYELREAGVPWDKDGGIVTQVKAAFPGYTTNSAIPLRRIYHAHKAKMESAFKLPATKKQVTAARDKGWGWAAISAPPGKSIAEVKKLYTGQHPAGRADTDQDGNISTVLLESTSAVHEARQEAANEAANEGDQEEPQEGDTPEADAADQGDVAA